MKKSILNFKLMKASGEPITWITSYSYPMAHASERAGVDMLLVGDSGGMVELGHTTTNPVTMDEMIQLAKAARRGAPNTFIVGDMPQGSYEVCDEDAVLNAMRFVKEAGCDAVKLEGGKRVCSRIKAITDAGILVVAHLGLTPQSTTSFGGYRVQGKTLTSFDQTMKDAFAVQEAGACMLLLEAMPQQSAQQVSMQLEIPVLGIGAGVVDGQLIIIHDLLGFYPTFRPWFAKCYVPQVLPIFASSLENQPDIKRFGIETRHDGFNELVYLCVKEYIKETKERLYPSNEYTYSIKDTELDTIKQSTYWQ